MAAYFRLFLDRRGGASPEQEAWLAKQEAQLTDAERAAAERIVKDYRPRPTALTLKGLSGLRAAEALADTAR